MSGLTQQALGRILGVTQPAIAAYEAERRHPTGRVLAWWGAVDLATTTPHRRHGAHRGRPIDLPTARWQPAVSADAVVVLPARLDWSARAQPERDLSDPDDRASTYAQVLEEGTPVDIATWIDPDLLAAMWPDLPIARHLLEPVGAMLAEVGGQ